MAHARLRPRRSGVIALADSSIWVSAIRRRDLGFLSAVERGEIAVCGPVVLELLVGAPNADTVGAWRIALAGLPQLPIDEAVTERAEQVVELLADQRGGGHRGVPASDLLIAACAERAEVPVIHADAHFERIAAVTGQLHWRLAA